MRKNYLLEFLKPSVITNKVKRELFYMYRKDKVNFDVVYQLLKVFDKYIVKEIDGVPVKINEQLGFGTVDSTIPLEKFNKTKSAIKNLDLLATGKIPYDSIKYLPFMYYISWFNRYTSLIKMDIAPEILLHYNNTLKIDFIDRLLVSKFYRYFSILGKLQFIVGSIYMTNHKIDFKLNETQQHDLKMLLPILLNPDKLLVTCRDDDLKPTYTRIQELLDYILNELFNEISTTALYNKSAIIEARAETVQTTKQEILKDIEE